MKSRKWTLWGKNAAYTGTFIKLEIGTLAACGREHRSREKGKGWTLAITRFGEKPSE